MFEIRPGRAAQGRQKLTREREHYFELVAQGVKNREACQIVGVNEKTGREWRNGRSKRYPRQKRPPLTTPKALPMGVVSPSRYLTEAERVLIADHHFAGSSIRKIAAGLGRSPSTISREIQRNRHIGNGQYRPFAAHGRAMLRRSRPKPCKILVNPELRAYVQERLLERWSPEQIARSLRRRFPNRPEMHVVHETIYQSLYVPSRGSLRREVAVALRTGRVRRKPHRQSQRRQSRYRDPMLMISERPAEALDRAIPGHWEGDLIIGQNSKSAIGTLVERTTRFVMLVHLPDDHGSMSMHDALIETISTLPLHLRRSLTWDQGSEMGQHKAISSAVGMPIYFCDPASPWQRGSNENANGLLRQYFPKGTNLALHSREELDRVAAELNGRPRKTLGWETPAERLAALLQT